MHDLFFLILYSPALTTCMLQFAGPNEATMASAIAAGPTNSVVIDKQGMYWMAGKWKNSGEGTFSRPTSSSRGTKTYARAGSSGSPYSTFRFMQDIMYVVPLGIAFYCSFPSRSSDHGSHECLGDARSSSRVLGA